MGGVFNLGISRKHIYIYYYYVYIYILLLLCIYIYTTICNAPPRFNMESKFNWICEMMILFWGVDCILAVTSYYKWWIVVRDTQQFGNEIAVKVMRETMREGRDTQAGFLQVRILNGFYMILLLISIKW